MTDAYASDPNLPPTQSQERPAELLDRFVAKLIDFVIVGVVYAIIAAIIGVAVAVGTGSSWIVGVVTSVILVALQLGYFTFLESSRGQTVGKMVMKLRVMGPDAGLPTTEEALKRNIWMAISLIGIIPLIGWLIQAVAWIAALVTIAMGINNDTAKRQAWHDQLAGGTRVVKIG
ncbi:RDD family protein [Janibacter cremeus]|uniref:Putative RDD family membrane protein YckC n=1 Tax=Janibacter cremeus TaxID=1285192 RepID=A0A852VW28_9MICO|nr:RDD family protein [Janibacter cremeus]NYF97975.1 putative RDD family membrane protein YckC [Janibacter cremeus]